jgi:hypothetical protein
MLHKELGVTDSPNTFLSMLKSLAATRSESGILLFHVVCTEVDGHGRSESVQEGGYTARTDSRAYVEHEKWVLPVYKYWTEVAKKLPVRGRDIPNGRLGGMYDTSCIRQCA